MGLKSRDVVMGVVNIFLNKKNIKSKEYFYNYLDTLLFITLAILIWFSLEKGVYPCFFAALVLLPNSDLAKGKFIFRNVTPIPILYMLKNHCMA